MSLSNRRVVLACALLLAAGCNKTSAPAPQPAPGVSRPPAGSPTVTAAPAGWTMNVQAMGPPDAPAAGRVGGQEFRPDKVEYDGDALTFRQGKGFFADREIKLLGLGGPDLRAGLKLVVTPDKELGPNVPHVHASWKKGGGALPEPQMHLGKYALKYALKLEVGKPEGGQVKGKIHLCLPDEARSFLAGSFALEAASFGLARIEGSVTIKGDANKPYQLSVSYLGHDAGGKPRGGHCGFSVTPGTAASVSSSASRLESKEKGGIAFRHGNVAPGTYLVLLAWGERSLDWRWVEVKGPGDVRVDLTVDPAALGELEVSLPAGAKERRVQLLPLDKDGRLPEKAGRASALALQVGNYVPGARAEAPEGQDKVTFRGVGAGSYRVVAGGAAADAAVKAGQTARVALK
jgi:hypothetical protein